MKKIHKQQLTLEPFLEEITAPQDAVFLSVHRQGALPCLWYECTPGTSPTTWIVYKVPTGENVPPDSHFVGTVLLAGDFYVLHIYVRKAS